MHLSITRSLRWEARSIVFRLNCSKVAPKPKVYYSTAAPRRTLMLPLYELSIPLRNSGSRRGAGALRLLRTPVTAREPGTAVSDHQHFAEVLQSESGDARTTEGLWRG